MLIRYVATDQHFTATSATKLLEHDIGKKVSKWTVRRALEKENFYAIEKKRKPALSKKNIKARLSFVKKYKNWTSDDWMKVIWSDETKINRYTSDGRSCAWLRKGEPLQTKHVKQTIKHGGGSLMLWGCMTAFGMGPVHQIQGIMNKEIYLDILRQNLGQAIENMPYPENEVVFQQDRDPKHTAKIVTNWLTNQSFTLLEWPAQSPDLNPIENFGRI